MQSYFPDFAIHKKALLENGFSLLHQAIDVSTIENLRQACNRYFESSLEEQSTRSSQGHVYAARNLMENIPELQTFWQTPALLKFLAEILGNQFGLVRILFFDKPPDRSWVLPWHKDLSIAVREHKVASSYFSRPTVKAGVAHVIAEDSILQRMLTLRIHLDVVTNENGPLRVVPQSHASRSSDGVGFENSETVYANAGDVLVMRPLITHCSGAASPNTTKHRRVLHLEFSADSELPDGYRWHSFVSARIEEAIPSLRSRSSL